MNIKQLIAVGALAIGFSSCGLFGNAVTGGPAFSGTVATTTAVPDASSYKLALVRFTAFTTGGSDTFQAAAFATTIAINGGTGAYSGFLAPNLDLGNDSQRFYKVAIYDDKTKDDIYNTTATGPNGEKDALLADSTNGSSAGGNRFFVYAKTDGNWTAGEDLKAGWNLVTDTNKDSNLLADTGRSDDSVTQAGGFGGITITYP